MSERGQKNVNLGLLQSRILLLFGFAWGVNQLKLVASETPKTPLSEQKHYVFRCSLGGELHKGYGVNSEFGAFSRPPQLWVSQLTGGWLSKCLCDLAEKIWGPSFFRTSKIVCFYCCFASAGGWKRIIVATYNNRSQPLFKSLQLGVSLNSGGWFFALIRSTKEGDCPQQHHFCQKRQHAKACLTRAQRAVCNSYYFFEKLKDKRKKRNRTPTHLFLAGRRFLECSHWAQWLHSKKSLSR